MFGSSPFSAQLIIRRRIISIQNRRVFIKQLRADVPLREDFVVEDQSIDAVPKGHVVVKVDTLSMDAWIRTTLNDTGFHERSGIGTTIRAFGVGEVVESNSDTLAVGEAVYGMLSAQTHACVPAESLKKVDVQNGISLRDYIGPLGLTTGLTAWVGLIAVGNVQPSDVVLVSGAAGAVGSVVVQLAKARGAFVIGIAGGAEKCRYLTEVIGADVALDYKSGDVAAGLAKAAPNGINVFFDNVGGELLDIALDNLALADARVAICGAISQYEDLSKVRGPSLYLRLAERNAMMKGFVVSHYAAQFPAAKQEISDLIRAGKMTLPEHVVEGIDCFPDALFMLFGGAHTGNLVVRP